MTSSLPPLTWFRAFESAARHLSFTRAAKELNLTQSAISQHVRALEDKFGCALFVRKHRSIALTDQGRRLLPSVTAAVAALSSAAATFETGHERPILSISASVSMSRWYIVPYLKEFAALYPHYAFRVSTKTWPDEFANVETDVEIRFDSRKSADSSAQLMQPNAMVVVGAPILCAGVSPHDWVTTLPLIHVVGTADTWQRWADLNAVKDDLSGTYFVESHGNAVDLARTGAGIALTNAFVAAPGLRDGTLTRMPNTQMAALDGYYMQIKKGPNHHIAGIFAKWLREKMASSIAQTLPDQWLTSAE